MSIEIEHILQARVECEIAHLDLANELIADCISQIDELLSSAECVIEICDETEIAQNEKSALWIRILNSTNVDRDTLLLRKLLKKVCENEHLSQLGEIVDYSRGHEIPGSFRYLPASNFEVFTDPPEWFR